MSEAFYNLDLGDSRMMLRTSSLATKVTPKRRASTRAPKGSSWDTLDGFLVVVRICYVGCATLSWWWDRHQTNGKIVSCTTGAVRCHKRLLKTTPDKEVFQQLLENDEEEWKSVVRGLVTHNELRSEAARRAARAQIKNRENYIDSGQVEAEAAQTTKKKRKVAKAVETLV